MRLPSELILHVIECLIPPTVPVVFHRSHPVTRTLLSLSLVCKLTTQPAQRLLQKYCLYIDSEHRLDQVLKQNERLSPAGLFLAPFPEDNLDQPEIVKQIDQLSARICNHLTRLVISMPLRYLYPEEDHNHLRPILRAAFSRLTELEEFCSVQDELYLSTVEDDSEPPVWSFWPRLRRLALYNADVSSPRFAEGISRCTSLTRLVLTRPDGWMDPMIDEEMNFDAFTSLRFLTVIDTKVGQFYLLWNANALGSSFYELLRRASVVDESLATTADHSLSGLRVKEVFLDVPEGREDEDIEICQEWLLEQAVHRELWM
ncbi:hypothetical protein BBP40_008075 [Aspergillus hancockii]|nr:hypothetical protein BBP40_008075 [Aspergillus hancockii]